MMTTDDAVDFFMNFHDTRLAWLLISSSTKISLRIVRFTLAAKVEINFPSLHCQDQEKGLIPTSLHSLLVNARHAIVSTSTFDLCRL